MSSDDPHSLPELASLIGSRICHDLISPIGAIGNGLELLDMAGTGSAELALITDSVANANAKIRFFRIAFGLASPDQGAARAQILSILDDVYRHTRVKVDWAVANDCYRAEAKAAFLAIMCLESALPFGGEIHVSRGDGAWHLKGQGSKLKFEPDLWSAARDGNNPAIIPKSVQFPLLHDALSRLGRGLTLDRGDTAITLGF